MYASNPFESPRGNSHDSRWPLRYTTLVVLAAMLILPIAGLAFFVTCSAATFTMPAPPAHAYGMGVVIGCCAFCFTVIKLGKRLARLVRRLDQQARLSAPPPPAAPPAAGRKPR